jgi:hypothetical protein
VAGQCLDEKLWTHADHQDGKRWGEDKT